MTTSAANIGALYSSHSDWLRQWLRRHTQCSYRAEDLAQDTFCRLLDTRTSEPVHDPRRYLATLARRILIDDIRHREIERAYLTAHAIRMGNADHLTPERIAEATQLLGAILDLLETLPEKARRAFMMIRFDGLRYGPAAEQLGVSERMAKRYVAQAYAHFYALAHAT